MMLDQRGSSRLTSTEIGVCCGLDSPSSILPVDLYMIKKTSAVKVTGFYFVYIQWRRSVCFRQPIRIWIKASTKLPVYTNSCHISVGIVVDKFSELWVASQKHLRLFAFAAAGLTNNVRRKT